MLPIISAALGIAQAVGLDSWIINKLSSSDSGAANLAGKVIQLATEVTGEKDPEKCANSLMGDRDAMAEFKLLAEVNQQELLMAGYEDRKDARQMYNKHSNQADLIADRVMKYNLPYICIALLANVLAVYYMRDAGAVLAAISSVLGMAIKSLFDERMAVTGFYFGSSMGSKNKDK